jgi:hypothetical protein
MGAKAKVPKKPKKAKGSVNNPYPIALEDAIVWDCPECYKQCIAYGQTADDSMFYKEKLSCDCGTWVIGDEDAR